MTAAEKANEMVEKYYQAIKDVLDVNNAFYYSQQCALIVVDEILETIENIHKPEYVAFDIYEPRKFHLEGSESEDNLSGYEMKEYWQQVKAEIKNSNPQP